MEDAVAGRALTRRLALLATFAFAAFAACARGPSSATPTIRADVTRFLAYAPFFVAHELGYFRDEGVAVELVDLMPREALAALVGGRIDVFSGQLTAGLFNAIATGAPLALVADKGHVPLPGTGCTYDGLLARPGLLAEGRLSVSPVLRGLRVSVQPHGIPDYCLEKLLERAGVARAEMSISYLDTARTMEAFRQDALDLKFTAEPSLTRAPRLGVAQLWLPASALVPGQQTGAVVFGPRLLRQDRKAGRRFIAAYLRAVREINRGKSPAFVALVARRTGQPEDLVREACWGNLRDDGEIDVASVLAFQEWAKGKGAQDMVVPAERFWDPSFVRAARKQ